MGVGSKKNKGANAKAREKAKGKNQGPKRLGVTKPPSKSLTGSSGVRRLMGKKEKKAAATAAAWALLNGGNTKPSKPTKAVHTYY